MRTFQNIAEAYLEIKRDLSKSPLMTQTRVQHLPINAELREAMNYTYTIAEFPSTLTAYLDTAVELGAMDRDAADELIPWMQEELDARLYWSAGLTTERRHPALSKLLEGNEPSYTYTDRLRGAAQMFVDTLSSSPDTRRAYWPIYQPEDAVRAPRMTRIPCSLGYQMALRTVQGREGLFLHMTYLQRSCDFGLFWWSDLWLARQFQEWVLNELNSLAFIQDSNLPPIRHGQLTHIVLSLHSFLDGEIY